MRMEAIMKSDTIAAIATAMSPSGIGIIRISGENSLKIIDSIYRSKNGKKRLSEVDSHTVHYGFIFDGEEEIDEVMVMSVAPGASGQQFQPDALHKISILAATRKKYGLKYTISVDGGINDKNAQLCWDAGADLLVSGSYLSRASDFPLAVQKLLPQSNTEK